MRKEILFFIIAAGFGWSFIAKDDRPKIKEIALVTPFKMFCLKT